MSCKFNIALWIRKNKFQPKSPNNKILLAKTKINKQFITTIKAQLENLFIKMFMDKSPTRLTLELHPIETTLVTPLTERVLMKAGYRFMQSHNIKKIMFFIISLTITVLLNKVELCLMTFLMRMDLILPIFHSLWIKIPK